MQQLASSIVWAVRGEEGVADLGFRSEKVNKGLLFPVSEMSNSASCVCDTWYDTQLDIEIDAPQMLHCILQRRYYMTNFARLQSANIARFVAVHLPRIVFCMALYKFLAESKYGFLVRKLEKSLVAEASSTF